MSVRFVAALVLSVLVSFAAPTHAQTAITAAQKTEIQAIIKEYLVSNPIVLEEALSALQAKLQNDERTRQTSAISGNIDKLQATDIAPASGNPQGDVTLVEFFDYRCGYCRSMAKTVDEFLATDPKVRLVFREFPILGPVSVTASKAALASAAQGKYMAFHNALMSGMRQLGTDEDVYAVAASVGLDLTRLKADMESQAVKDELATNFQLAESMGIRGTPAFVIGNQMYPGALPVDGLKNAVAQARLANAAAKP